MNAHFLAEQVHARRWALLYRLARQEEIDGDRGLMAMGHCRNNVLRTKGGVATKEDLGIAGLERPLINLRHIPFAKLDAEIALDPRKGVVLANGNQHLVGLEEDLLAGGDQTALAGVVIHHLDLIEGHAQQFAVFVDEGLRHVVIDNRNIFGLGVFDLPGGGLHLGKL